MIPVTLIAEVAKSSGILPSSSTSRPRDEGTKILVGDPVLKTGSYKGRDWQDEINDLVGDQMPCICKPDAQAYKHVAPNALKSSLAMAG